MNHVKFVDYLNDVRKASKDSWVFVNDTVTGLNGLHYEIKFYNTWTQYLRINGITHTTVMGNNVGQWKKELLEAFEYHLGKEKAI